MKGHSTPHRILMNLKGAKDESRPGESLGATHQCVSDGVLGRSFHLLSQWRWGMEIHVAAGTQGVLMCWKPQKCLRITTWKVLLDWPISCGEDEGKAVDVAFQISVKLWVFSTVFSWRKRLLMAWMGALFTVKNCLGGWAQSPGEWCCIHLASSHK